MAISSDGSTIVAWDGSGPDDPLGVVIQRINLDGTPDGTALDPDGEEGSVPPIPLRGVAPYAVNRSWV